MCTACAPPYFNMPCLEGREKISKFASDNKRAALTRQPILKNSQHGKGTIIHTRTRTHRNVRAQKV